MPNCSGGMAYLSHFFQAIDTLLQLGVGAVVITSIQFKSATNLVLLAKSQRGELLRRVL